MAELQGLGILRFEAKGAGDGLLGFREFRFHAEGRGEADPGLSKGGRVADRLAKMLFSDGVITALGIEIAELILRERDGGVDGDDLLEDGTLAFGVTGFVEGDGKLVAEQSVVWSCGEGFAVELHRSLGISLIESEGGFGSFADCESVGVLFFDSGLVAEHLLACAVRIAEGAQDVRELEMRLGIFVPEGDGLLELWFGGGRVVKVGEGDAEVRAQVG